MKTKKCKHQLHFIKFIKECIGHERLSADCGICAQLSLESDPKGGRHRKYAYFICEKCGEEIKIETKESKELK